MQNSLCRSVAKMAAAAATGGGTCTVPYLSPALQYLVDYLLESNYEGFEPLRVFCEYPVPERATSVPPEGTCLMLGAGMDSTIAYFWYCIHQGKTPDTVVWVDYGHEYAAKERVFVDWFSARFQRVDIAECHLPTRKKEWDYIFPLRNLLLAAIGAQFNRDVWVISSQRLESANAVRDKTAKFYKGASAILTEYYGVLMNVDTPFEDMTRTTELAWMLASVKDAEQTIQQTVSCYHPEHLRCGLCNSCWKRWVSMKLNRIEEEYWSVPYRHLDFWNEFVPKELSYGGQRAKEIMQAMALTMCVPKP